MQKYHFTLYVGTSIFLHRSPSGTPWGTRYDPISDVVWASPQEALPYRSTLFTTFRVVSSMTHQYTSRHVDDHTPLVLACTSTIISCQVRQNEKPVSVKWPAVLVETLYYCSSLNRQIGIVIHWMKSAPNWIQCLSDVAWVRPLEVDCGDFAQKYFTWCHSTSSICCN